MKSPMLWWHVEELKHPEGADWANPNAEIAKYLELFSVNVSDDMIEESGMFVSKT